MVWDIKTWKFITTRQQFFLNMAFCVDLYLFSFHAFCIVSLVTVWRWPYYHLLSSIYKCCSWPNSYLFYLTQADPGVIASHVMYTLAMERLCTRLYHPSVEEMSAKRNELAEALTNIARQRLLAVHSSSSTASQQGAQATHSSRRSTTSWWLWLRGGVFV